MNQNQLQKARLTRWRQDGNALLTLDDAERWLAETPLCLYLPRYQHLPVPAPSFVEAVAGRADATPGPQAVSAAAALMARLVASGAAVALNLIGSPSGIVGEQPDFLATPEALQYLYAMQPQRNPKKAPTTTGGSRVSPLAAEAFAILTREGALTAVELRERLGREVTEAAVLRALGELWHSMRAVPVPQEDGTPAHWELLTMRHRRELNVGSTQSQTTALSVLVSFYLQSVIAATAEETGLFLSPLSPRSRIQDAIHGLSVTRQLASFSLDGTEQFYVEGTLPEVEEEEEALAAIHGDAAQAASDLDDADLDAGLEENEPSFPEAEGRPMTPAARPSAPRGRFAARALSGAAASRARQGGYRRPERRGDRPAPARGETFRGGDESPRPPRQAGSFDRPRSDRPRFEKRGTGKPDFRKSRFERPAAEGERRPYRREGEEGRPAERKPFEKRPYTKDRAPRPFDRERPSGDRPPRREGSFRPRGVSDRGPRKEGFRPRPSGEGRPPRREGGERPSFEKRPYTKDRAPRSFDRDRPSGDRPPRREGSFRPRPADGERRPFRREGGDRPRPASGERPSFEKRRYTKDRAPRSFDRERPSGDRPPLREGSFRPRPADGERRPFRREGGDRPRPASGERKPFEKRPYTKDRAPRPFDRERPAGDRPPRREGGFRPRPADGERRPFRREGAEGRPRPASGERKPFEKRPYTKDRAPRPFDRERSSGDRPPRREGSFRPRPADGERRPYRPSAKSGEGRSFERKGPAKPRFGGAKPFNKSGKSFGKPGGGGKRFGNNKPGGAPPRKPRRESGEGDEG